MAGGSYRGFYNGGPDYNRLRGVTARPIQQLSIQRNTGSALVRRQIRNGTFNRISAATRSTWPRPASRRAACATDA